MAADSNGRARFEALRAVAERLLASVLSVLSYLVGIGFGLGAGFVLRADQAAAFICLALAVLFVAAGLAVRAKHRDDDQAAADRWTGIGLLPIGIVMSTLSVIWLTAGVDRDGVVLVVVSFGLLVAAGTMWHRGQSGSGIHIVAVDPGPI